MAGTVNEGKVGVGEQRPASGVLVHGGGKSMLKRSNQVKVLLNDEELTHLDWIVDQMGSDRSSAMRYLLASIPTMQLEGKTHDSEGKSSNDKLTKIRIGEVPSPRYNVAPSIKIFEPREFDQVPQAIEAIREGESVIVNLTMMTPDQAQRAVDFVAGGTFYGGGHQERIGESVFLFASKEFNVSNMSAVGDDKKIKIAGAKTHHIAASSDGISALAASADSNESNSDKDEKLDNCLVPIVNEELMESSVESLPIDLEEEE
jgi:FtsZ-interacting cell division protein YlmF